jgi:long-chain fatty acid transport protein
LDVRQIVISSGLRSVIGVSLALAGSTALTGVARAAGIGVPEQDTWAIAQSTGGETTEAEPSIAYYNPAGMVLIDGTEVETDATFYDIHSDVNSTLIPDPAAPEGPGLTGHATGFVESTAVANAFGVFSLPYGIKAGFSITQPDAGRVKYPSDFVGNYEADEALLTDIQMGFDVAVPVYGGLSVGGGPIVDYFQDILGVTQNLPLGLGADTPNGDGAIGHFTGKSYRIGYNAGAMYQFSPEFRVGVDYRSQIKHDNKGNQLVDQGGLAALIGPLGPPPASPAFTNFLFPQTVSFGAFDQITPEWAVMGNAAWTNWAAYKTLYVDDPTTAQAFLVGPNISPVVENFHFRNAWTVGIATAYTPAMMPKLALTTGVGYDETPVPSALYRVAGLPDDNRILLGFGGKYALTDKISLTGAYAHYFIQNGGIRDQRLDETGGTAYAGTLVGEYKLSADVFDVGMVAKF